MEKRREVVSGESLLKANALIAEEIRREFTKRRCLLVNILSSPGTGKTTLLQNLVPLLGIRVGVIVGDIETDRDRKRLSSSGIEAVQITTGGTCHLEAYMIRQVIFDDPLKEKDMIFIENVGNLVCPASYDLGEHLRMVMVSTTEGEDKPRKYPKAFVTSHLLVINKSDLIPHLQFDLENLLKDALAINKSLRIFVVSALKGRGLDDLAQFFLGELKKLKNA